MLIEENEYGEPEQHVIDNYDCLFNKVSRHVTDRLGHDVITDGAMIFNADVPLKAEYWIEHDGEIYSIINLDAPVDAMGDKSHIEVDLKLGKSISRGIGS